MHLCSHDVKNFLIILEVKFEPNQGWSKIYSVMGSWSWVLNQISSSKDYSYQNISENYFVYWWLFSFNTLMLLAWNPTPYLQDGFINHVLPLHFPIYSTTSLFVCVIWSCQSYFVWCLNHTRSVLNQKSQGNTCLYLDFFLSEC